MRDSNVVFFSLIIIFIISSFIFMLDFVLLCLGVWCFDYYYFMFPFGRRSLAFLYFSLSVTVLKSSCHISLSNCFIFMICQGQKITFLYYHSCLVSKSLACYLKSNALFPGFYRYFSIPSSCRVAPEIKMKCKITVFSCTLSLLVPLI